MTPPVAVGERVRFTATVDRYPHARVLAGETGTVTLAEPEVIEVTLDWSHPGLREWDNALVFADAMGTLEEFAAVTVRGGQADIPVCPQPARWGREDAMARVAVTLRVTAREAQHLRACVEMNAEANWGNDEVVPDDGRTWETFTDDLLRAVRAALAEEPR